MTKTQSASAYKDGVLRIRILSRVGLVDSECDAVGTYHEKNEPLEGSPLCNGDARPSDWVLDAHAE